MKIAILIGSLVRSGGAERQALMLGHELSFRGHLPVFYTFSVDFEKCFPLIIKEFRVVTLLPEIALSKNSARKLAGLVDSDTDILNPQDLKGAEIAYYVKRKRPKIPCVLMLNDLHIAQWSLFDDPAFSNPPKSFFGRALDWLHDIKGNMRFLRSADRIAVLNDRSVPLVRKYLGRDAVVVRSGLDVNAFAFMPRSLNEERPFRILAHGIFYIHRRYEDIIAAVAELRKRGVNVTLTIIGDYEHKKSAWNYYRRLVEYVRKADIMEAVTFRGRVSDSDLQFAYHNHDVFVFASHMQTWGLAVFEAMASGLPVIVSDTAGASEVLTNRENAIIVPALSATAIASGIDELMHGSKLYEKLSLGGRTFVAENVSWKRYCDEMLKLFKSYSQ